MLIKLKYKTGAKKDTRALTLLSNCRFAAKQLYMLELKSLSPFQSAWDLCKQLNSFWVISVFQLSKISTISSWFIFKGTCFLLQNFVWLWLYRCNWMLQFGLVAGTNWWVEMTRIYIYKHEIRGHGNGKLILELKIAEWWVVMFY